MSRSVSILAQGPWDAAQVHARWLEDPYEAPQHHVDAADAAIAALRRRDSPSHDGIAGRLAGHEVADDGRLLLDLQPARWALRLVEGDASAALAALCVTRSADGRWLAGRRAAWLSSWAGRWALGAGGSVDFGESPAATLSRELDEEWALTPERLSVECLMRLPQNLVMLIGLAWLPDGAEELLRMDDEHDAHAWWPADVRQWPDEADEPLRRMATMLAARDDA